MSKRISELTILTVPATDDVLPIVDTSATETKKVTVADLLAQATGSFLTVVKSTRPNGVDHFFEGWRTGEAYPRSYLDGFSSLYFGGLGTANPPLKLSKDPFNQEFINIQNTEGPATIVVVDSDVSYAGGPNAESTLTGRVRVGSGGSEWVDWFHNHYSTNGDMNYGILLQKISPGIYRNFLTLFTDNAAIDPKGQIKNANWFEIITPTIQVGTSNGFSIAGTNSATSGSSTMTGVGTSYTTSFLPNDSFAIGDEYKTIESIESDTSLTINSTFVSDHTAAVVNKFTRFLGRKGMRVRNPTAFLHIAGGVGGSTEGSASLKLGNATALLTTPEAGAIENSAGNLYYSPGDGVRKSFLFANYGLSGGQTIIGGNGSAENILLESTSHATKGKVIFGAAATSAYVESSDRLGIGTNAPTAKAYFKGGESGADGLLAAVAIENSATGGDVWYLRAGATSTNTPAGGFSIGNGTAYALKLTATGRTIMRGIDSAIADDALSGSEISFYLNEAGNTLVVKAKYAAGTVKTGTVALT